MEVKGSTEVKGSMEVKTSMEVKVITEVQVSTEVKAMVVQLLKGQGEPLQRKSHTPLHRPVFQGKLSSSSFLLELDPRPENPGLFGGPFSA